MLEKMKALIDGEKRDERRVRAADKRVISWSGNRGMDSTSATATFREDRTEPKVSVRVKPCRDFAKTAELNDGDLDDLAAFLVEVMQEREKRRSGP